MYESFNSYVLFYIKFFKLQIKTEEIESERKTVFSCKFYKIKMKRLCKIFLLNVFEHKYSERKGLVTISCYVKKDVKRTKKKLLN